MFIDSTPLLLDNQSERGHWLQVKLDGVSARTIGVRVVARRGDKAWIRMAHAGSGYLSHNTSILHFGFGLLDRLDDLTISWHHCEPQIISPPELDQCLNVKSGS